MNLDIFQMYRALKAKVCLLEKTVNSAIGQFTGTTIGKIQIRVGTDIGIADGDEAYVLANDSSIPYQNIKEGSVKVTLDFSRLPEGVSFTKSYTITYNSTSTVVTFTEAASVEQFYIFDFEVNLVNSNT